MFNFEMCIQNFRPDLTLSKVRSSSPKFISSLFQSGTGPTKTSQGFFLKLPACIPLTQTTGSLPLGTVGIARRPSPVDPPKWCRSASQLSYGDGWTLGKKKGCKQMENHTRSAVHEAWEPTPLTEAPREHCYIELLHVLKVTNDGHIYNCGLVFQQLDTCQYNMRLKTSCTSNQYRVVAIMATPSSRRILVGFKIYRACITQIL